jgi:hypothetical protein
VEGFPAPGQLEDPEQPKSPEYADYCYSPSDIKATVLYNNIEEAENNDYHIKGVELIKKVALEPES